MSPQLRGRQAEAARNDLRVLEAARELVGRLGYDTTMEQVARSAGVGVGSLYRRYGGKDELLQHLCELALEENLEAARRAAQLDDPWAGLRSYVRACVGFGAGAFSAVAGRIGVTGTMERLSAEILSHVDRLVAAAHDSGALRHDAGAFDVLFLIEQFSRRRAPADDDDVSHQRLLTIVLDGLAAPGGEALGGPSPSLDDYARRWRR